MKNLALTLSIVVGVFLGGATLHADPILTLNPLSGNLAGQPGSTVGWGFTLTNGTDFVVVAAANYITVTPVGTFTDFISPQFVVVGPGSEAINPWTESFNNGSSMGIGSYAIGPGAPLGALSTGQIQITYDLYSVSPNDPNFDPATDTISAGNILDTPATVLVVAVPEPSALALAGTGLLTAWSFGRRRR